MSSSYVHPLSDAVLTELKRVAPPWFKADDVVFNPKEGSISLDFKATIILESETKKTTGNIHTVYDKDARHHFLYVKFGRLAGRVSLTDASKSAWQSNIGDDLAKIPSTVEDLCLRIDEASRGIFPESEKAQQPTPRPTPAPVFPFPDLVRTPEG